MKSAIIAAISIMLGGCASLPPILQRWADLEIATQNLHREDSTTNESLYFYEYGQVGRVEVGPAAENAAAVPWRVRGPWLEIDTANDGTYRMRLRALTWTKDRVVALNPAGKKSVWRIDHVVVVIMPIPPRPGMWMP
jgi:hypothetical protein